MSPSPNPSSTDRNLLFGVLALQLDFLGRDALIAGMNAWAVDKAKPLGRILCEQGAMSPARLGLLDALVEEHVDRHGGDAAVSLAAAASGTTLSEAFDEVADSEVQTTLTEITRRRSKTRPTVRDDSRYRNLRPHARGGLGQVFVADDAELNREVAVKEIQPHRADDPASRARFLREAEITGALEHPGVIPIYGLGTHTDGRPYYAMRFVRGESLKTAIERYHADGPVAGKAGELRRLLRRFIEVCNAVAYAHSRGVIHRDLKPQNVMLGPFGETLVVDWGLAKAGVDLGGDPANDVTTDPAVRPASGSGVPATQAGSALGTPGYMSPEQAAGRHDEVGPASDVFGLGATLYCLLAGRKPFDGTNVDDALTLAKKGQCQPAREVAPETPAALDAVCRKAMAFHPADRYPTPLDLAADLERWLADEPVMVYRDPWLVRATRWGRRHRTVFAASVVLLVTAVVASSIGTGLIWREQRKTVEQKKEAEENYALARDLSGSGIELIAADEAQYAADPVKHKARKELLVAAAKAFHKHVQLQPADPEVRRQAARVYRYAANVRRLEREHAAAGVLYRDAVELLEGLAKQFPDEPEYRVQLSGTLRDQAKVQSTLGHLAESVTALDRVIELADGVLAVKPDDAWNRRTRALGLLARAGVQIARGKTIEAITDAKAAAALFEALAQAPADAHPYDPLLHAAALNDLAVLEREAGRLDKAAQFHAAAINLTDPLANEKKPGRSPVDVEHFRAIFWLEKARTEVLAGRHANAERIFGLTAQTWERMGKKDGAPADCLENCGVAHYERGCVRATNGPRDGALAELEKSQTILEAEVKRSPDVPALSGHLGRTYAGLARLARDGGDRTAAADWFRKAVDALKSDVERAPEQARDVHDLREIETESRR